MPNPVAVNDLSPISGSLQTSRVSYGVETAGKNYGQAYNSSTWYSDIPNNGQFYTIISDNYTANYYVSRSNAGGAYVEGGLPAVDEYSAPVFWVTVGTSSLDVITIVNGLPDRVGQVPFNSGSQALNWVASSSNYFAVGPDYYPQIDADNLIFCVEGNQVISYPTTGSTWYDLSGYFMKGTLTNGTAWNSTDYMVFDGTDDYINFGTNSVFNVGTTGSLSVDVLFKTTGTTGALVTKRLGSGPQVYVLSSKFYADGGGTAGVSSANNVNNNRWNKGTAIFDRASSLLRLFVNGVADNTTAFGSTTLTDTSDLYLGTALLGTSIPHDFYTGSIAEVLIYPKALTAAEVAQNYYGGPIVTSGLIFAVDAGNLVSYPKSGTSWYNLTGSVDGTLTNGPTFSPADGGELIFDGTDDYINFGSPGSLFNPATSTMTMMGWIYVKNNQTNILIGLQESGAGSLSLGTNSSGNVRFICRPTAGPQGTIDSSATLALNTWYHIAMTKDTANSISDCTLWINGSPVNTASSTVNFPTSTAAIRSAYYFDANIYSNINIGSIQVYNRALTAAEVLQNYNATK